VSVGQAVSGSGGVGGGTEVLAIADLNEMIIQAHINQADVTRLKNNQDVDVQVEAVPGLTVMGRVERIAPQATIKNNIKGFLARILLRKVDPRIRPGMTANIKIPVATVANVVTVPLAAVYTEYNQESGRTERYVYVKSNSQYERRPVEIGLSDYFHAEIQNGLAEGEVISLEHPPENLIKPAVVPSGPESGNETTAKGRGAGSKPEGPSGGTKAKPVASGANQGAQS
jgi:HlyD family secretion protein